MTDDSADQTFEELREIVQQTILREFPNPERNGCLGTEMLRELANRPRPTRDAAWEHVTHCSPCYREFLDLRAQVKKQREIESRRLIRRRVVAVVTAALGVGVAVAAYEVLHRASILPPKGGGSYQAASLDLKYRSVARGASETNPSLALVLRKERLDLTILLPIGSEPGHYEIQLLKKIDEPLLDVSGDAVVEQHGITTLRARVDLSALMAGSYLIGLRQPPAEWTYYPVSVQ